MLMPPMPPRRPCQLPCLPLSGRFRLAFPTATVLTHRHRHSERKADSSAVIPQRPEHEVRLPTRNRAVETRRRDQAPHRMYVPRTSPGWDGLSPGGTGDSLCEAGVWRTRSARKGRAGRGVSRPARGVLQRVRQRWGSLAAGPHASPVVAPRVRAADAAELSRVRMRRGAVGLARMGSAGSARARSTPVAALPLREGEGWGRN
jgi:hypothetical protein